MKFSVLAFQCIVFVIFCLNAEILSTHQEDNDLLNEQKKDHQPKIIDEENIWSISTELQNVDDVKESLKTILIPRVPGTEGHAKVKQFIIDRMTSLGWHVDTDKFTDETPIFGNVEFENIIATLNPNAERYLSLACHYDSKYMPKIEFVGATDSAVPCAIMLNLAKTLQKYYKMLSYTDLSLQFIFFDGEEAFKNWSPTDSIYGSRHLAAKWEEQDFLKKIDLLVLLDLLGAASPTFYSYILSGGKWFNHLVEIEFRLNAIGAKTHNAHSSAISKDSDAFFVPYSFHAGIEDDHVPFMARNVSILHMIPYPYPECWHEETDNFDAIDFDTVANLSKIIGIFTLEYLHCIVD